MKITCVPNYLIFWTVTVKEYFCRKKKKGNPVNLVNGMEVVTIKKLVGLIMLT